ncbi:Flp pilus assembly protein CpaB, partial [bacterium]
ETGLAVNVPIGKRAMILHINNIDVIELIKPSDYVDVLTTFSAKHRTKGTVKVTVTVLQNVLVVGVSKDLGEVEGESYSYRKKKREEKETKTLAMLTVSVAVTPEEAQILALAQMQGDITLTVRATNDREEKPLSPVDSSLFFS